MHREGETVRSFALLFSGASPEMFCWTENSFQPEASPAVYGFCLDGQGTEELTVFVRSGRKKMM
jgi:hypothetical protein